MYVLFLILTLRYSELVGPPGRCIHGVAQKERYCSVANVANVAL